MSDKKLFSTTRKFPKRTMTTSSSTVPPHDEPHGEKCFLEHVWNANVSDDKRWLRFGNAAVVQPPCEHLNETLSLCNNPEKLAEPHERRKNLWGWLNLIFQALSHQTSPQWRGARWRETKNSNFIVSWQCKWKKNSITLGKINHFSHNSREIPSSGCRKTEEKSHTIKKEI